MLTWVQNRVKFKIKVYKVISGEYSNILCRQHTVESAECLPLLLFGALQIIALESL
jgi:hypothetical protein